MGPPDGRMRSLETDQYSDVCRSDCFHISTTIRRIYMKLSVSLPAPQENDFRIIW